MKIKKYALTMINSNGYTIKKDFNSIEKAKTFAKFYPLEAFFAWIYSIEKDEMLYQNCYKPKFKKCNNDNFVPYY